MKFYTYNQNNSGGLFTLDKERGLTHFVIIEAENSVAANNKAEDIGIYFDGLGDCPCCGNRWWPSDEDEGTETPEAYGKPVTEITGLRWMEAGHEAVVHYADGRKEWF